MIDSDNRTFICSVVYYDIADYSKKSVEVQIRLKEQLNRFTTEAIKNVAVNDRIILDTGDGAAICFLGDPEDALFVAMNLRDAVLSTTQQLSDDPLLVRFGINLGSVKMVNDINNRKNIIGDGINVGQRIMSFAEPGQILVSRSYFEVVSCLTREYAKLFHYLGTRADKHVRQHEVYAIMLPSEQAESAAESPGRGARIPDREKFTDNKKRIASPDSPSGFEQNSGNGKWRSASASNSRLHWWQTKRFAFGSAAAVIVLAVILSFILYKNFGGGEIRFDKTAPPPEATLKSPEAALPEKTPPAENVVPEKSEPAMPEPLAPAITPGEKTPAELPTETATPPEGVVSDKPEPAIPETAAPAITPKEEAPAGSPPESIQPKETTGSEQTVQIQTKPSLPDATIQFAITPWAEVFVDGKSLGVSPPLTSFSVAPGKHVVEVVNSAFPPFSQTIEIGSEEQLKFVHKFK